MDRRQEDVGRRLRLLEAARAFVTSAAACAGVRQIALIGSICTPKPHPKDIDLVLTLEPGIELGELARLARRLNGTVIQIPGGTGSDVFVVENGQYIGRLCHYREPWQRRVCACCRLMCAPGRQFLCDTAANFRLNQDVVQHPPVTLWPEVVVNAATVPADVRSCFGLAPTDLA
jgi:predicted nucleotidyltransferase